MHDAQYARVSSALDILHEEGEEEAHEEEKDHAPDEEPLLAIEPPSSPGVVVGHQPQVQERGRRESVPKARPRRAGAKRSGVKVSALEAFDKRPSHQPRPSPACCAFVFVALLAFVFVVFGFGLQGSHWLRERAALKSRDVLLREKLARDNAMLLAAEAKLKEATTAKDTISTLWQRQRTEALRSEQRLQELHAAYGHLAERLNASSGALVRHKDNATRLAREAALGQAVARRLRRFSPATPPGARGAACWGRAGPPEMPHDAASEMIATPLPT